MMPGDLQPPSKTWIGRIVCGADNRTLDLAVLANGRDQAQALVLARLGADVPVHWREPLVTIDEWAVRNGPEDAAFDLILGLDPLQPVVFGRSTATGLVASADPFPSNDTAGLTITDLGVIQPLGDQFGVHPAKAAPDRLADLMFSQDGQLAYALIDAAGVPNLARRLDRERIPSRCLFSNEVAEELGDVAPYLVRLPPDAKFTRDLFTQTQDQNESHYYRSDAAILLLSDAGLDAVWSHLRKYTRMVDDFGKSFYFRFWDPSFRHFVVDSPEGPFPRGFFDRITLLLIRTEGDHWYTAAKSAPEKVLPHANFFNAFQTNTKRRRREVFLNRTQTHLAGRLGESLNPRQLALLYRQARDRGYATERGIVKQMESLYLWRVNRLSEAKVLAYPELAKALSFSDPMRAGAVLTATQKILEARE
jgi:hypothetical protein